MEYNECFYAVVAIREDGKVVVRRSGKLESALRKILERVLSKLSDGIAEFYEFRLIKSEKSLIDNLEENPYVYDLDWFNSSVENGEINILKSIENGKLV